MKLIVKKDFLLFISFSLFLSLIVGFRGNTRDTIVYYNVFKHISEFDLLNPSTFYNQTGMEIGFGWYSQIISLFSGTIVLVFWSWSLWTFYSLYLVTQKIKIKFIWVLLLYISSGYFLIWQFMQIRQGLAVPLAFYAISMFIINKNKLFFVFLSLLSIAIHQSALIIIFCGMFCSLFSHYHKMGILRFKIFSLLLFLVLILLNKLIFINVLNILSERISSYSEIYLNVENGLRLPDVKALIILLILMFFSTENMYSNKVYQTFYLMFVIGVACRIGFIDLPILSGRFASALTFSEIFILPFIFYRFKSLGVTFIIFFIALQAISTYGFQVPDDFYESYFYEYK